MLTYWRYIIKEYLVTVYNRALRLVECIKSLGFSNGIRYFNINEACTENPSLSERWAENCEREAEQMRKEGNLSKAWVLNDWAAKLRAKSEEWKQKKSKDVF